MKAKYSALIWILISIFFMIKGFIDNSTFFAILSIMGSLFSFYWIFKTIVESNKRQGIKNKQDYEKKVEQSIETKPEIEQKPLEKKKVEKLWIDTYPKIINKKSKIEKPPKITYQPPTVVDTTLIDLDDIKAKKKRKWKAIKKPKKILVKKPSLEKEPSKPRIIEPTLVDNGQRATFPPSKTEKLLEKELRLHGLNPISQYQFKEIEKYGYKLDLAFPEVKVDIEVDGTGGDFKHHLTEERKRKDGVRDDVLQSLGWKVRRFTDKEVWENPLVVAYQVKRFLERNK